MEITKLGFRSCGFSICWSLGESLSLFPLPLAPSTVEQGEEPSYLQGSLESPLLWKELLQQQTDHSLMFSDLTGRGVVAITTFLRRLTPWESLGCGACRRCTPRQGHWRPLKDTQPAVPFPQQCLPPPTLFQPRHCPLLQQMNQILSSWTVQWKVSLKRQYIIFHEFNRVFMILQSASTRHSQLEAAQREAEALHLGFSTLAKIH